VADQIVTVISPLQIEAAGNHTVTLGLEPEGLGMVQATVSVSAQQITISLWAGSGQGHSALAQALPQLHSRLAEDTTRSVTVELARFGSSQLGPQGDPRGSSPRPHPTRPVEVAGPDGANRESPTALLSGSALRLSGVTNTGVDLRL
jgi:hypothetical protein